MKTVAGQMEMIREMYEMGLIDEEQIKEIMIYGSSTVKVDILKDYFTLPALDVIIVSPPTDCGIEAVPNDLLEKEL